MILKILIIVYEVKDICDICSDMGRGEKKSGQVNVRLEPSLMAAVDAAAEKEDRPVAAMARILIKEALDARAKKGKKKTP